MADVEITLVVEDTASVGLRVEEDGQRETELKLDVPYVDGGPPYRGPYVVRPQPYNGQVLETAHRKMLQDVRVEQIPYYITTNYSGGYTAIIGD